MNNIKQIKNGRVERSPATKRLKINRIESESSVTSVNIDKFVKKIQFNFVTKINQLKYNY